MQNLLEVDPNSKWIIDTDPGIDDSFALILAMTTIKENLVAISIEAGNTGLENCYNNARKISAICNEYFPVFKGVSQCLSSDKGKNAEKVHGKDGLYEIADFQTYTEKYETMKKKIDPTVFDSKISPLKIIELSYKYKKINILALGPLSNLALAFMLDPSLPKRISKLVIMGGSYTSIGNIQPCVEFNFYFDPIAAKIVINNFENIIVYPWETDQLHRLRLNDMEKVDVENDKMKFCRICIEKKLKVLEERKHDVSIGADFPDYGAGIAAFIPNSVKKYSIVNADIVVDSVPEVNGSFLTSYSMNLPKGKKIILVEQLEQEMFVESFRKMIK